MRLNDPLVTSFIYEDTEYPIDLAFDNVLDVFDVLEDEDLREHEKAEISLELLIGPSFDAFNAIDLWNHVYMQFIHIESKQLIEYDRKGNPMPVQEEIKQSMDLDKDAEYIYASFQEAYNIDLFQMQGKLQWSQFKALLSGLPNDTIMRRIEHIRLWEPSKGDSAEYKADMKKLQRIHALDEEEVDE